MRLRFRLLCLGLIVGVLGAPWPALAQGTSSIERLDVGLWPEYDKPSMLVIYRVTLPSTTPLPATVRLPIPARVGEPAAVAEQSADGSLLVATYTRQAVGGDWAVIEMKAQTAHVQLEYYDALALDNSARSFSFTWPAGYPLGDLAYEVQQPAGATDVAIVPAPGSTRIGPDGLTYLDGDLGVQDGATQATISVSYTKTGSGLTVDTLPTPAPTQGPAIVPAQPPAATSTLTLTSLLPWIAGGLGIALLGVGVVLFVRSGRESSGGRAKRHKPTAGEPEQSGLDAAVIFCHNCGTPASVTDVYCRKCGTRLRQ